MEGEALWDVTYVMDLPVPPSISAILESEMPCGFVQTEAYGQLSPGMGSYRAGSEVNSERSGRHGLWGPRARGRWGRAHHARRPNTKE